ncbi:MAG: biotin-dependent carboxyltransferase family protein [Mycobacterium sp.]
MTALEVLRTGALTLVEDLGRPGLAHIGVTRSGAADRRAHRLANRLVANPDGFATLEITMGGFSACVRGGAVDVAVTGADACPLSDGVAFGVNSVRRLESGQVLSIGVPPAGLRSYLAVRGGIAVPPVLGSRSYDTLSALGPRPLQPGDVLPVGRTGVGYPELDLAPVAPVPTGGVDLRAVAGPRDDWFTDPDALVRTGWVVSERSDRVGLRLTGPALMPRWPGRELPSEGATRGAVQVPPNGQPVILGPDHPVTGGYPVIAVVVDADLDTVAQLRPGQPVRLHWHRPHTAAPAPSGW